MQRTILITGCSSGIGHRCANGLKVRGWRVFAAARKPADVERLAAEGFESVGVDYDRVETIAAGLDTVLEATGGRLDALFHNGGFAVAGAIEDISVDAMRAQFETNFFGWHELTRRVIPVMRRQRSGRIVFCSSILGFVAGRYRGAYVASKFAIEGYADTLRLELADSGIDIVLIEPGPIASRFRANAIEHIRRNVDIEASVHRRQYEKDLAGRENGHKKKTPFQLGPEAVLAKLVKALDSRRPKPRYRVTVPTHVAALLKRLLPARTLDRIVGRARRPEVKKPG